MRSMNYLIVCFGMLMVMSVAAQTSASDSLPRPAPAKGPLRVHPENPRYFTDATKTRDASLKAVYLTGSHTWYNLRDSGTIGEPLTHFDYSAYLDLLQSSGHNLMRMWAWEGGVNKNYCAPLAYRRTGPGTAWDEKPKFNLNQFNQEYFDRLRARVVAAGQRGIYVSVMLFQGWSIYDHDYGNPWPRHPFNAANIANGINGDPDGDGQGKDVHTLQVPAITRLQETYVRKVVDTLNDLDNVLYEVTNETALFSQDWQYYIVRYIKSYQAAKPKQHPVGITAFDSGREGSMEALLGSAADWISPQNDGASGDYMNDPPPADGRKVIISDTDHLWGVGGDRIWVWKSFTRGLNPIYMDPLSKPDWVRSSEAEMEGARKAMGDTRRYAERMNPSTSLRAGLAAMVPRCDLASSKYCLANPGAEYLVYLPADGEVTVDLSAAKGILQMEWVHVARPSWPCFHGLEARATGTVKPAAPVQGGSQCRFQTLFNGDTALHLGGK